jgi:hypothetical protein
MRASSTIFTIAAREIALTTQRWDFQAIAARWVKAYPNIK